MKGSELFGVVERATQGWRAWGRVRRWVRDGRGSVVLCGVPSGVRDFVVGLLVHTLSELRLAALVQVETPDEGRRYGELLQREGYNASYIASWSERRDFSVEYIAMERSTALARVIGEEPAVLVATADGLSSPVPSREYIRARCAEIAVGEGCAPQRVATQLSAAGYRRVANARMHGEFSLRGEIVDVYPIMSERAWRVQFDFESVVSIQPYDPLTQRSRGEPSGGGVRSLVVPPLCEWELDKVSDMLSDMVQSKVVGGKGWSKREIGEWGEDWERIERELAEAAEETGGTIQWAPYGHLFFAERGSVRELFERPLVVNVSDLENNSQDIASILKNNSQGTVNGGLRAGSGATFVADVSEVSDSTLTRLKNHSQGMGDKGLGADSGDTSLSDSSDSADSILKNNSQDSQDSVTGAFPTLSIVSERLSEYISGGAGGSAPPNTVGIDLNCRRVPLFFGNHELFRQELARLTSEGVEHYIIVSERTAFLDLERRFPSSTPVQSALGQSVYIPDARLAFFNARDIYPLAAERTLDAEQPSLYQQLYSLDQITEGDCVVHTRHGIGRYEGLERLRVDTSERDYLRIAYHDHELIYLPIEQINLIRKYIGVSDHPPQLDVLGGKVWERRQKMVAQHTQEMATHLLALYARRKVQRGCTFPPATEWLRIVNRRFPHQPTASQVRCIQEVMKDLERPAPMDRLICGDVGYGKTEVAIRAVCRVLHAEKQVALLAPTTVLAEQHRATFADRFCDLPVKIGMLSRLVPRRTQREVVAGLRDHSVDLVIGTHRLLQPDIVFDDLGLLVIDEEQRFGVRDKERLKSLKSSVDIVSMTATPIPRTLHLSLTQLRDISLVNDPPRERRAIHTTVREFSNEIVHAALLRELQRGGQVFWLHNRIETIEQRARTVAELVPQARIRCVHGSLAAPHLDSIMYDFVHHAFDILVTTTIIENGIDIPNVNTLILERADLLGVSQLYQLRGRIGRSSRQAYAFLLYPNAALLDRRVASRLQTIAQNSDLGSGFAVALRDLEVRGAGNILGKEQSGDIHAVGYEMYVKLLDTAIRSIESTPHELSAPEPFLELRYSAYIPEEYIENRATRLEIYQKIATATSQPDIVRLEQELNERFGAPPTAIVELLAIARIRFLCRQLHIVSLHEREGSVRMALGKIARINQSALEGHIASGVMSIHPRSPHIVEITQSTTEEDAQRHERLIALLDTLRILGVEE